MAANRLLIIDDEPAIAALVAKVAKTCGYEATIAGSGEEFQARHRDWTPTHVIMDLQMPGLDGVELIRFLAGEKSRAQVMVMSGFDARVLESARRLGTERGLTMAGTLAKPIRVADLQKMLDGLKIPDQVIDEAALRAAIAGGQLSLLYQPKVRLDNFAVSRFEALVRWQHPQRGMVSPDEFISLAERVGLIDDLTREVARLAFAQIAAWRGQGHEIEVAINISGKNLSAVDFADGLARQCEQQGVQPGWVTLELTETAAGANAADVIDILTRLRLKGFQLSIDDFGTGFSSLVQLHRLPFSEIKIDREFVRGCTTSEEDRVIVRTIVDMAHNLGLTVVAEGAEDRPTVEFLAQHRCDLCQGFFFSRPLAADKAVSWTDGMAERVAAGKALEGRAAV